jgi:hypothetical protein
MDFLMHIALPGHSIDITHTSRSSISLPEGYFIILQPCFLYYLLGGGHLVLEGIVGSPL